jgi:hypothetical protein
MTKQELLKVVETLMLSAVGVGKGKCVNKVLLNSLSARAV